MSDGQRVHTLGSLRLSPLGRLRLYPRASEAWAGAVAEAEAAGAGVRGAEAGVCGWGSRGGCEAGVLPWVGSRFLGLPAYQRTRRKACPLPYLFCRVRTLRAVQGVNCGVVASRARQQDIYRHAAAGALFLFSLKGKQECTQHNGAHHRSLAHRLDGSAVLRRHHDELGTRLHHAYRRLWRHVVREACSNASNQALR